MEFLRLAWTALIGHPLRTVLSMLGIAIGVGSVVLLTSLGEGTRLYIVDQFTQFGTNLVAINPGKSETVGIPGVLGGTQHPLTLEDARALQRLPHVETLVPMAFGTARVEGNGRGRSVFVFGVTPDVPEVWKMDVRQGSFWEGEDITRGGNDAVLGPKLKQELFGVEPALGKFVRIGDSRFRVIGVMESKGLMLGFDFDDAVHIPVASAMRIFNQQELTEIDLLYASGYTADETVEAVISTIKERHGGREDITVMSQAAMLETFGNIMNIVTLAVAGIAGVSLLVGAVGILTMMWIAVGERTHEIGLVRSIGATRSQVRSLFLVEAAALSTLGGLVGLLVALGICALARLAVPGLPVSTPPLYVALALGISLATGVLSGVLPASRAAGLDPIEALRTE